MQGSVPGGGKVLFVHWAPAPACGSTRGGKVPSSALGEGQQKGREGGMGGPGQGFSNFLVLRTLHTRISYSGPQRAFVTWGSHQLFTILEPKRETIKIFPNFVASNDNKPIACERKSTDMYIFLKNYSKKRKMQATSVALFYIPASFP